MTLEEYAVEKIKDLESDKVELTVKIKSLESKYKTATQLMKKQREEIKEIIETVGRYLEFEDEHSNFQFNFYKTFWKSELPNDPRKQKDFDVLMKIVVEAKEAAEAAAKEATEEKPTETVEIGDVF